MENQTTATTTQEKVDVIKTLPLARKISEISKMVGSVSSEKKQGLKYKIASSASIVSPVSEALRAFRVIIVPSIVEKSVEALRIPSATGTGSSEVFKTYFVNIKLKYTIINADNPAEKIELDWMATGEDAQDPAKALGKALTYSNKYLYRTLFAIPVNDDDPDVPSNNSYNSYNKGYNGYNNGYNAPAYNNNQQVPAYNQQAVPNSAK